MKTLENGLKEALLSSGTILGGGLEILQVFQLQSRNKEWRGVEMEVSETLLKKKKGRGGFSFCSKRIFRGLKETSMGNGTDSQTEICSCTITDMRKIEPLRGARFGNKSRTK